VSFSKVDFSGLPKSSSTIRGGGDQTGGCPSRQTVGLPFRGSGSNGTEKSMRQKPKAGWLSPSRVVDSGIGWKAAIRVRRSIPSPRDRLSRRPRREGFCFARCRCLLLAAEDG
jgi:hypothetical protein